MRNRFSRIGILAALILGTAQAGVNSWTVTSPDGGLAYSVAIHPTNPAVMLAQTNGGFYRTTDAGDHWSQTIASSFNGPGANGAIVFDPSDPAANRAFIASIGVFRSSDGGQTFTAVTNPTPRSIEEIAVAGDGMLYIGDHDSRVFRSGDQGQNWTEVSVPWPAPIAFGLRELIVDPNNPATLYVSITQLGIFRSDDRGATWMAPITGSPGTSTGGDVTSVAVQPGNSNRLLAAGSNAYYVSIDRGSTWTPFPTFFQNSTWVGFDPSAPDNAVVLSSQGSVIRSADGGDTWPPLLGGASLGLLSVPRAAFAPSRAGRLIAATSDGPFLSDDGGLTFTQRVTGIHGGKVSDFAVADDGTLYAGFEYGTFGIYRHDSGGWRPVNNAALRAAVNSPQLGELTTSAINSDLIYAVNHNGEVVRSDDGGASWSGITGAYTVNGHPQDVAIDPSNPEIVYVATYSEGLWKSTDGGASWNRLSGGLPDRVDVIAVDPADTQRLYVLTTDQPQGLYKSIDGGLNWTPIGNLQSGTRTGITFDPEDPQILYIYSGSDVLKTRNGGASWTPLNFGPPGDTYARAMAVLVDPGAHDTIWVVSHPYTPGFSRSIDGGLTWERVTLVLPQGDFPFLDEAVLDPLRPNVLHVGATLLGIVEYEVAPDLAVSIEGLSNPLAADSTVHGTVTVRNLGPHASTAAELRINLPAWATVATVPQGCRPYPAMLICELSALLVGLPQTVPLALSLDQAPSTGQISATVAGHERDPVSSNDVATRDIASTTQANIALVIETGTPTAGHGDLVTFVARISNPGPSRARDAHMELQLGTLTAEDIVAPPNACTRNGATVSCAFGSLAGADTLTVTVHAVATAIGANTVTGTVTRAGTGEEATDSAALTIQARPVADFSVETTDSPDPAVSGSVVTYTSVVRNNGPDAGTAVFSMPSTGLTLNSINISNGTCGISGGVTALCTVNSLASGATATITVGATANTAGTATVTSNAAFDGIDRIAANNQAVASTVITAPPGSGSSSGGGGGGRFDWLAAVLSGLLLARRRFNRSELAKHV